MTLFERIMLSIEVDNKSSESPKLFIKGRMKDCLYNKKYKKFYISKN